MKFTDKTIKKVQANEYDINVVEEILKKIIKRDFNHKSKIKYKLNKNYTTQPDYKETSPNNSIAYAEPKTENITMIVADIPTFMSVFGTGQENINNITFPRLSLRYNYSANNYFKIFHLLFHELEHANQFAKFYQWVVPISKYNDEAKKYGKKRLKQLIEISINIISYYFIGNVDDDLYLMQHELVSDEHQAETEGVYKTIKLFERHFPNQLESVDTVSLLLNTLLNEYEINDNKLISPYDKLLETLKPFTNAEIIKYQKFIKKNLAILDNYTLLSYGMPIDKDLFLEVQNSNINAFNSVTELKKYIKRL